MKSKTREQLEAVAAQWSDALERRDLARGLEIAMGGYADARATDSREYRLMFLGFIRLASEGLYSDLSVNKSDRKPDGACSFCLRQMPRLVRGVGVAICADCIEEARNALQE